MDFQTHTRSSSHWLKHQALIHPSNELDTNISTINKWVDVVFCLTGIMGSLYLVLRLQIWLCFGSYLCKNTKNSKQFINFQAPLSEVFAFVLISYKLLLSLWPRNTYPLIHLVWTHENKGCTDHKSQGSDGITYFKSQLDCVLNLGGWAKWITDQLRPVTPVMRITLDDWPASFASVLVACTLRLTAASVCRSTTSGRRSAAQWTITSGWDGDTFKQVSLF